MWGTVTRPAATATATAAAADPALETQGAVPPATDNNASVEAVVGTETDVGDETGLTRLVSLAPGPEQLRRKRTVAKLVLTGLVAAIPVLVAALYLVSR